MSYKENTYNTLNVTYQDAIAIIQFNRPQALNANNMEMGRERAEVLGHISRDESIRVVIFTGNERAYCAGGDLSEFADYDEEHALTHIMRLAEGQKRMMTMPQITIAAVAGYAFGGGMESVMTCDLRIAAENAMFSQPEINVGFFPGAGGTQRLVQNVSVCRAKEMILMGKRIDAQTAYEWGIINKVVPLEELMPTAIEWAEKLCKKPPIALRTARNLINSAWGTKTEDGILEEARLWASMFSTEDQKEGARAFLEKRKPVFKGR